jgi:hypothetical protein
LATLTSSFAICLFPPFFPKIVSIPATCSWISEEVLLIIIFPRLKKKVLQYLYMALSLVPTAWHLFLSLLLLEKT